MSLADAKLHLVDSIDDVLALNAWLGERRPRHALAFDTETTGLVVGHDVVRTVQIGDGRHGWVMPWTSEVGAEGRFIGGWSGVFADVVKKWDGIWLAHNAKFDTGMLGHMRVQMPRERVHDTRIMAHVLRPDLSTALKNVAARLVDPAAASLQDDLRNTSWTWATVPIDYQPYWTYAALDPILTWQVYDVLWPQVEAECLEAFRLENEVSWVIERMERNGAHVNVAFAREKLDAFRAYVEDAERWCVEHYDVRPGSNADVVRVLQNAGIEFTKATASGAVALDKEVLGGLYHPLARVVLQRRQIQKIASTYLEHFVTEADADDLIHPSINVLGARTSRMSMERPNLQNLPRRNEGNRAADVVRDTVTTRYEFGRMVMSDFDQVEMRMLASMANERAMIDAFKSDQDFFVALAHMVYEDDTIVKSDPRRQIVKNAGYATIYAAGVPKFALTAGIDLAQAQRVRRRWDTLFPGVARFMQDVIRVGAERGRTEGRPYVRCPVTRRYQVCNRGKEYALINYLIQGAAAAVFKRKLIELNDAGLGEWMVVPVHDEIVLDVPEEHVSDAVETLRKVMNDDTMFQVPITASVSHGATWGGKEAYE